MHWSKPYILFFWFCVHPKDSLTACTWQRPTNPLRLVGRGTFTLPQGDDMLNHINMVKFLVDQLTCLEVPVKKEDVVMTLLFSLPPLFNQLITTLETHMMKELMSKISSHTSCTRCLKRRRKNLKEMMQPWCHANLECSITMKGVLTTWSLQLW